MSQTPCYRWSDNDTIDYTPPTNPVNAGDVVLLGNVVTMAMLPIAVGVLGALQARGTFICPKDGSVFAAGDPVYWNPAGSPTVGTALSGAMTSTTEGNELAGYAVLPQLTGDATVTVYLSSGPKAPGVLTTETVAALGTNQATAAPIGLGFTLVTGANATVGVELPVAPAGAVCEVKNGAAAALLVYPPAGGTINGIAANGALSMAANTSAVFRSLNGTAWYTIPLVPS